MNNTFEHNRNILNSINSFNLLEKVRHNAPRNNKQITNLNPSNLPPKPELIKPKRQISDAQREHLNNIRSKALKKKAEMKEETLKKN